jgi:hypothetical protein
MAYETSRAPGDASHREHGGLPSPAEPSAGVRHPGDGPQETDRGALSGEGVRVHHPQDAAPVGGLLPGHVNPGISLGDILGYSGLIGKLVSGFVALKGAAVGAAVPVPILETYLPGLGEWDLQITATRVR